MITENNTLQELFEYAKNATDMVRKGETFMVKDLFTGLEWNRIPKSLRTKLGGMFLLYVRMQSPQVFSENGKTPQNQQIYKKL